MSTEDLARAADALRRINGQICQCVIPGMGELTTLAISFGDEVESYWSARGRKRISLYRFKIRTSSAWRLDGPDRVLCSFDDEKPRGGEVRRLLGELEGQRVTGVRFDAPAGDLAIHFERGQVIRVFCCARYGACGGDYFFLDNLPGRKESFQVGPRGNIDFEWPRDYSARKTGTE